MTDLYDAAAALPRLLRAEHRPHPARSLPRPAAVRWTASTGHLHQARPDPQARPDLLDVVRGTLRVAPPAAVAAYHTAAQLHGFGVVPVRAVHVAVPSGTPVPQRRGVTAHESKLPFGELTEVCGLPCLPAPRTAVDLARTLPRPDALAVLDAALRSGAVTAETLGAELLRHDRLRGIRQARELAAIASPLAECRQETHLRLVLHDGRLPAPTPRLGVSDEWGVERHRTDLGYQRQRVGIEYDGIAHLDRRGSRLDPRRHDWLTRQGWTIRYVSDDDLYRRPDLLVAAIRATLTRRSWWRPRRYTEAPHAAAG
ncbi:MULTISPECIES: DUF559 domain-containing protein [Polymorphospora]|uniref:DUF559 domain-containing protein n=1 Tax=Polymorphospora lycopeni TaxID=3140240 RepID=A0ABV5CRJ3_9ACTN